VDLPPAYHRQHDIDDHAHYRAGERDAVDARLDAWTMFVVTDGEKGEFGGDWWQGNTFTWHGTMQDMLAGHFYNREIVWTRRGESGLAWNEYDVLAGGERVLFLSSICSMKPH
jgi:hypothetical protein